MSHVMEFRLFLRSRRGLESHCIRPELYQIREIFEMDWTDVNIRDLSLIEETVKATSQAQSFVILRIDSDTSLDLP